MFSLFKKAPDKALMEAVWQDQVIARSDKTIVVEGNHYFPPDSIDRQFFNESDHTSHCRWKGQAHYYDIKVAEQTNKNAAWYYPSPKSAADKIKGYIAFWNGVKIQRTKNG